MFNTIAKYYDYFKLHRDYEAEALEIDRILNESSFAIKSLVELGCGTGTLLANLQRIGYEVTGVDASQGMLNEAQRKLPSRTPLVLSSFLEFNPNAGDRFDAAVWIDGAIGYVPPELVEPTVINIKKNVLGSQGTLLIEPWYDQTNWRSDANHLVTHETEEGEIYIRLSHGNADGSIDFHHMFATREEIQHYADSTRFWLHDYSEVCACLGSIGLEVEMIPPSTVFKRGLIVATV